MNEPTRNSLRFGLTKAHFSILDQLLIQPLKLSGAKVWIFGSRARGDHRPASDVDIIYELPSGHSLPSGLLFTITSNMEESRFPYLLDLVNVKDLALSYREGVMSEKIEL